MKNREWLLKTAAVDVLCIMNSRLRDVYGACVMNGFMTEDSMCERCQNYDYGERCRDCIAAWLDEER